MRATFLYTSLLLGLTLLGQTQVDTYWTFENGLTGQGRFIRYNGSRDDIGRVTVYPYDTIRQRFRSRRMTYDLTQLRSLVTQGDTLVRPVQWQDQRWSGFVLHRDSLSLIKAYNTDEESTFFLVYQGQDYQLSVRHPTHTLYNILPSFCPNLQYPSPLRSDSTILTFVINANRCFGVQKEALMIQNARHEWALRLTYPMNANASVHLPWRRKSYLGLDYTYLP
ncbi:MAG: hypothetical protein AAGJ82_02185, partial [Bacteroidota bacterium]